MEKLPTETLNSIIQHFCLHCAQIEEDDTYFRCRQGQPQQPEAPSWYLVEYRKPLYSLCLVSRRLRDVVQPLLHHEFILGFGDSWRSTQYSWDRRLTSFLRTDSERRDLAAEVQRVLLHPHLQNSSEFDDDEGFEGVEDLASSLGFKLSRASRPPKPPKSPTTGFQYSPGDMALLSAYTMTASCGMDSRKENIRYHVSTSGSKHRYCLAAELFAILITRLPNIQRLSLQPNVFYSEAISNKVLATARTPILSRLKMLDISTRDCMTFFNLIQEAKALVSLPATSLTTLNLHMCDTFWAKARNAPPPPALASLQHLSLTRSRLTSEQLSQLISTCSSGLRSFTFEAAYPYDTKWQFDLEHFQPSDAIACLGAHQKTLESLHLDLRARGRNPPFTHDCDTDGGRIHPAPSLQSFTALNHLLINSSSICGSSRTPDLRLAADTRQPLVGFPPPDIITLDIVGHLGPRDSPHLERGLLDLVKCIRRGQFRRLKRIRCDSGQGLGVEFASLFDEVSVEFSCQKWSLTESTVTAMDVPSAFGHLTSRLDDEFDDLDL